MASCTDTEVHVDTPTLASVQEAIPASFPPCLEQGGH